jgi:hypothetical protein
MQRRVISAIASLLASISAASAQSYDLTKQFATKTNTDKNVWSYRMGDADGHDGNYTLLTKKGKFAITKHGKAATLKDWDTPSQSFDVPLFLANKGHGDVTFGSNGQQITIPRSTVLYHPGYGFPAVVSFLAAAAGTAAITYDYTHLDWSCGTSGAGIDWSIEKNSGNGALASGHLLSQSQTQIDSTGTQHVNVSVAAGDRINFIVDGVANPPNCDSTGLAASVDLN